MAKAKSEWPDLIPEPTPALSTGTEPMAAEVVGVMTSAMPKPPTTMPVMCGRPSIACLKYSRNLKFLPITAGSVATIAIDKMEFLAPIHLRDVISVYAEVEHVGRTSMRIRIEVVATRDRGATEVKVTEGIFTFVAIDDQARPRPVDQPA
mgnify:CR=1 FL=1